MNILKELLVDTVKPNLLHEVEWLMDYMQSGCSKGQPIFLSLGETWKYTPQKLLDSLSTAPRHVHGYHLSMYGYPPLRQTVHAYLAAQYGLLDKWHKEGLYETAIAATGTRSAMYDYACWLKDKYYTTHEPVLLTMAPGWDYDGVFASAGFKVQYIPLQKEHGFIPQIKDILSAIEKSLAQKEKPTLALNFQHNPTGINWSPEIATSIIELAIDNDLPLLIDDAYFGIHAPEVKPTAGLSILLNKLSHIQATAYPWFFVRSLGKQFSCNGWGIGITSAAPAILSEIVNNYQIRHHYNINGLFQYALSQWLASPDADAFTKQRNQQIQDNRLFFLYEIERRLGYPLKEAPTSTCTNFQLFPIPKKYASYDKGANLFVKDCVYQTGILYTDAWPAPDNTDNKTESLYYARVFLGTDQVHLVDAVDRMEKSNFFYQ